jgi:hypothetical protein
MSVLFYSSIDVHQHGLRVGTAVASVGVTVLADDDGRSDGPFGRIVIEGDRRIEQERYATAFLCEVRSPAGRS